MYKTILEAYEILKNQPLRTDYYRFYTGGTGIPDELAVDYWKDSDVVVVTRDGTEWLRGKPREKHTHL